MMRVLWLKFGELLPTDTGGKLRSFHLLKELARRTELTFVSYGLAPMTPGYRDALRAVLPESEAYEVHDLPPWRKVGIWPVVLSAARGIPLNVSRFSSRHARREVRALMARKPFDIGVCDFLTPSWVFPRRPAFPTLLFEHNVEWALWARRAATIPLGPKRLLYRWETSRTRAVERHSLSRFDATIAVSEGDRQDLLTMDPTADIHVLPTGVDVAAFSRPPGCMPMPGLVVFLGSMDWQPNADGVRWFVEQVWPAVREAVPGARFRIVGRRPPEGIQRLATHDIEVTGDVESVQSHLYEAMVTVVPLRAGGGTRLKIFEAMAAGAPVISTTIGAEGLDVVSDRDLILADEPAPFAARVIDMLTDPDLRRRLSANGVARVRGSDWSVVAEQLERLMCSMVVAREPSR